MHKIYITILITILITINLNAQKRNQSPEIKWYTIEQAQELSKKTPKLIMIDFSTDWCGWCRRMEATTFKHAEIVAYLNKYFYPVKFNAETKDSINYLDSVYTNRGFGRKSTHDLAIKLLNGKLTYPSILFLDKELKSITILPGYRKAKELLSILIYLREDIYKTSIPFQDFEKYFKNTYPEDQSELIPEDIVKWYTLEEALELSKKKPKKIFIDFYVNWQVGCNMMASTTYTNPDIGNYLNENYYPVRINALTRDTLTIGQKYINASPAPSYHQLPIAMLQGKMKFPTTIYLDENNKMVNIMQTYLTPEALEPVLKYFGENAYKKTKWIDYIKDFESELTINNDTTKTE